jgi:ASC-1-like (ASCH) protein
MLYEINIQEPYSGFIKQGIKTVEGRLNKSKFKEMKEGNELYLNQEMKLRVTKKTLYPSFREMIESEGVQNVIPNAHNLDEAEAVYYQFYSKEDERMYGVVGIEIEIIKYSLTQNKRFT